MAMLLFALRSQSICHTVWAMVHQRSAQKEFTCNVSLDRSTLFLEGSPPTEICCVNSPSSKESNRGIKRAVAIVGPMVYLPKPNPVSDAVGIVEITPSSTAYSGVLYARQAAVTARSLMPCMLVVPGRPGSLHLRNGASM